MRAGAVINPLVIHEFELMFLLDNKIVGVDDVCAWLCDMFNNNATDYESRYFSRRMHVKPIRFCIESKDCVFYDEATLRDHIGLEYKRSILAEYGGVAETFYEIHLLELAARLTPYAIVGGENYVMKCDMFGEGPVDRSLFHCLLCGRMCS
jgi:hypothetical protein